MEYHINVHDSEESSVIHQGIILVDPTTGAAKKICDYYSKFYPGKCAIYLSSTQRDVFERFVNGEIHTMVTTSELLDGFNCSSVSVLGIAFTISHSSWPIIGHSVVTVLNRCGPSDPIVAQVISHEYFHQARALDTFGKLYEVNLTEDSVCIKDMELSLQTLHMF